MPSPIPSPEPPASSPAQGRILPFPASEELRQARLEEVRAHRIAKGLPPDVPNTYRPTPPEEVARSMKRDEERLRRLGLLAD